MPQVIGKPPAGMATGLTRASRAGDWSFPARGGRGQRARCRSATTASCGRSPAGATATASASPTTGSPNQTAVWNLGSCSVFPSPAAYQVPPMDHTSWLLRCAVLTLSTT